MFKIIAVIIAALFMVSPVHAEGAATLSVSALPGSEIIAFYAAEKTDEGYESLISDIEDIESVSADYIISSGSLSELSYVTATADDDGYAVFEDLEAGIYLIAQNGIAEDENGVEYDFEPYLAVVSEGGNVLESDVQTVDDIEYAALYGTAEENDADIEEENDGTGAAWIVIIAALAVIIAAIVVVQKKKQSQGEEEMGLGDVLEDFNTGDMEDFYYDEEIQDFYK